MNASTGIPRAVHEEFKGVFTNIRCFKRTFLLQIREEDNLYVGPLKCQAHALQEPKDELTDYETTNNFIHSC